MVLGASTLGLVLGGDQNSDSYALVAIFHFAATSEDVRVYV